VAPVMQGLSYGTPAWADTGTIVPWTIYQMYGDKRILERHIDSMIRWVEWSRRNSTDLIRDRARGNDYGDWLSIDADTPKDLIGTAYFARSAQIVAETLRVLERDAESREYQRLADDIRAAFNSRYVDEQGHVAGQTQCGYLLALHFNLMPDALREAAAQHLVADIEAKGWRLSTGFVGVGMLLPALQDGGRADVVYRLLMQDAFPSWLFSVRHGATTIWERWNGWTPEQGVHPDAGMNSFNHYSLGSCGQWLFEGVGGIAPDPAHPGFGHHFFIRPQIAGPLTWAKTTYHSIRGEITTHWSVDGDRLTLRVTIPANTTATIEVPAGEGTELLESDKALEAAEVVLLERQARVAKLHVGSGSYVFTSTLPH
jgi:alpha-L-rhamnosidase